MKSVLPALHRQTPAQLAELQHHIDEAAELLRAISTALGWGATSPDQLSQTAHALLPDLGALVRSERTIRVAETHLGPLESRPTTAKETAA